MSKPLPLQPVWVDVGGLGVAEPLEATEMVTFWGKTVQPFVVVSGFIVEPWFVRLNDFVVLVLYLTFEPYNQQIATEKRARQHLIDSSAYSNNKRTTARMSYDGGWISATSKDLLPVKYE